MEVPVRQRYSGTKTDYVYEVLKEEILSGVLKPNERIITKNAADKLGLSETPVREALRRLEQDGLIVALPHKGAVVAELPIAEIEELLLIRGVLEGLAARLAAEVINSADIHEIEELQRKMEIAVEEGRLEQFGLLNRQFHQRIYEVVKYKHLTQLIESIWEKVPRARSVFMQDPEHQRISREEHQSLINALCARDGEEAERITIKHKERSFRALIEEAQRALTQGDNETQKLGGI